MSHKLCSLNCEWRIIWRQKKSMIQKQERKKRTCLRWPPRAPISSSIDTNVPAKVPRKRPYLNVSFRAVTIASPFVNTISFLKKKQQKTEFNYHHKWKIQFAIVIRIPIFTTFEAFFVSIALRSRRKQDRLWGQHRSKSLWPKQRRFSEASRTPSVESRRWRCWTRNEGSTTS